MNTLKHDTERARRLVLAIGLSVHEKLFVAADVIEFAKANFALRDALLQDLGEFNARKLGKYLRHIEGANLDGITVERRGTDRAGLVWRVCEFHRIQTRIRSDFS